MKKIILLIGLCIALLLSGCNFEYKLKCIMFNKNFTCLSQTADNYCKSIEQSYRGTDYDEIFMCVKNERDVYANSYKFTKEEIKKCFC